MRTDLVVAVMAAGLFAVPSFGADPLQPSYKAGEDVPILWEYRVTGPRAGQEGSLKCTYAYRPTAVLYCRDINPSVVWLIKKLDVATAQFGSREKGHLGSYVVLVSDTKDREKGLKELAEKEKIGHTILALVVVNKDSELHAKLGEAETTVLLTGPRHVVKASYAYRKGELKDKNIDQVLADLPKILLKRD